MVDTIKGSSPSPRHNPMFPQGGVPPAVPTDSSGFRGTDAAAYPPTNRRVGHPLFPSIPPAQFDSDRVALFMGYIKRDIDEWIAEHAARIPFDRNLLPLTVEKYITFWLAKEAGDTPSRIL